MLSVPLAGCTTFDASDIQSPEGQAVFVIARKELLKHFRSYMSNQVKSEFEQDPSMRYEVYEARLNAVQAFGRTHKEKGSAGDLISRETRNIVLKRHLNADDPIELVRWGPFYVDDEGSIKFNLSTLFGYFKSKPETSLLPSLVNDDTKSEKVWGDNWDTSARLRVNVNPFRAAASQDINEVINSYGLIISTTYSSDILHRKMFEIEYEAKISNAGEPTFFWNFALPF